MDWSALAVFVVVVLALFYLTGRRRRQESPKFQLAVNAISNINDDMRALETHYVDRQSAKKFKNGDLRDPEERFSFLDGPTIAALKEVYSLTNDFNQRIDNAKKAKALSTLNDLPLDKLSDPLNKSKAGLVSWLRGNLQTGSQFSRRNFLGF
jgi:hypothetical protein